MEFGFNINKLFPSDISMIDNKLNTARDLQKEQKDQLWEVIDKMGISSAKAQNLHGAITSASKMKYSDHHLYVMKDEEAHGGNGAVVGIIKVGCKKLFVYDRDGNQHEMEPLCVLDFYVHESRQRHGCGKKLFEHMLQAENIKPHKLAIDRPSHKFISFLQKHYGLKSTIRQVNNFVVFDGFFGDRQDAGSRRGRRDIKSPTHPYKFQDNRYNGFGTRSGTDRVKTLSLERQREALSNVQVQRQTSFERPPSGRITSATGRFERDADRAMGAQHGMYSRHTFDQRDDRQDESVNLPYVSQSPVLRKDIPTSLPLNGLDRQEVPRSGNRVRSPPLLRRNGPSNEYANLLNNHHNYLDRGGRMKVTQDSRSADSSPAHQPITHQYPMQFNRQEKFGTASPNVTWTPSHYGGSSPQFNPKYQQTRLW